MSNFSSEFNIVQVLLKSREILFQQIAYLTERQEVHANKIVNLEAEVDYLKANLRAYLIKTMKMQFENGYLIKKWMKMKLLMTIKIHFRDFINVINRKLHIQIPQDICDL